MAITRIFGSDYLQFDNAKIGIGIVPTALLGLAAGTAAAGTAPLKFATGTALSTPEDGAMEYDTSHLWFTIGGTRYQLDQQGGGHTQNTDLGTTSPTFYLNGPGTQLTDNFAAAVSTIGTGWGNLISLTLANDSVMTFSAIVNARVSSGGVTYGAGFEVKGVVKRGANAASTAVIDSVSVESLGEDLLPGDLTFMVRAVANTAGGTLDIDVSPPTADATKWCCIGHRAYSTV